ncbi:ferritin-like domain-containing protein [Flavimarina sp. Hel_I_48]|uniref:ferritin-like domain-containing protein n=1 Tax=Flavimarina sp. Hel_I_48 TaxID=1392488 RepID=UPI0004DF71FA|nr:PA2169 family four-helix-bundle protein [Flavimarina sp. Hel_I_48]
MNYSEEIGKKLNTLLEKNYDAEAGYKKAAEDVKNPTLKSYFESRAKDRYDFGHAIKAELSSYGQEPDKGTSIKGDLHRAWMDLKSAFSSDKEEAILEEAIRGEKAAIEDYDEIINDKEVPPSTSELLIKQRNLVQEALTKAQALEIAADNS